MELDKPKVEKLRDADNWQQWQFVMQTILDSEDALEICNRTERKPEEGVADYTGKLRSWTKRERLARKLIVTTVEAKPLQLLMNCSSASEMWIKLHSVYDLRSEESLALVQKQFFEFKWDVGGNIAQHISKLEQLANKMDKLGGSIPSSMLITRILSTLPAKFNHFYSAWDSTDQSKRTIENLTTRLLTEELRMEKQDDSEDSKTALFSKIQIRDNKKGQKKQFTNKQVNSGASTSRCSLCKKTNHVFKDCKGCFKCGSKEHLMKDCKSNKDSFHQNKREAFIGDIKLSSDDDCWLIDSGASHHMSKKLEWFSVYEEFEKPVIVYVGNGDKIAALGHGNIDIETYVDGQWSPATMYDVLFTPCMSKNLFSVRAAAQKGIDFMLSQNGSRCEFRRNDKVIALGTEMGNLYRIILRVILPTNECMTATVSDKLQLWHERLCHQNKRHVQSFLKEINIDLTMDNEFCDACVYGKHQRKTFGKREEIADKPREIIHSDVCGPMQVNSPGQKRYFVVFKDDFSAYRQVYFLREKSEVKDKLKLFCNEIKTKFGTDIMELHTDGGKEYVNQDVTSFLSERGIKHTVIAPYTPEQNGSAERENRILMEAARSMIYGKPHIPQFLWAEAINTAAFVLNRTGPTKFKEKSPYELWFDKKPRIDHLKVFGTECFVHVPKEKRRKLDKKAIKGIFVGYHEKVDGYRVWIPEKHDVIISHDVIFKAEKLTPTSTEIENHDQDKETETELHRHLVQALAFLIHKQKNCKSVDHVLDKINYDHITSVAETLYNRIIKRLNDYIDFDCSSTVSAIECFHAIILLINGQFKNNIVSFLSKVGGKSKDEPLIEHLKSFLEEFQKIFETEEDELSSDREVKKLPLAVFNNITALYSWIPSDCNVLSVQVYEWLKQIAYNNTIPSKVAGNFMNLLCETHIRYESGLALFEHTSNSFCDVYGSYNEDDSVEETGETLKIVNASSANSIIQSFCSYIKNILKDIESIIARIKSDYFISTYSGEDNDAKRREEQKAKEKGVTCQLCFIAKILTNLTALSLPPGNISDAIFKNIVQFYSSLTSLTRYFIGKSNKNDHTFQAVWFEKLVKLTGKVLAPMIYAFIYQLEAGQSKEDESTQSGKKKAEGALMKSKVLRETKIIPKVVVEMEQFSKYIIQLSKKTEHDFSKYIGQGTLRDFRIKRDHLDEELKRAGAANPVQSEGDEMETIIDLTTSDNEVNAMDINDENGNSASPPPAKKLKR